MASGGLHLEPLVKSLVKLSQTRPQRSSRAGAPTLPAVRVVIEEVPAACLKIPREELTNVGALIPRKEPDHVCLLGVFI